MNTDPAYAALFRSVYQEFSGIRVSTLNGRDWVQTATIRDVGPVGWKLVAARFPLDGAENLSVRLKFYPDNFMIDYVGCDFSNPSDLPVTEAVIHPVAVRDQLGASRSDVNSLLEADDGKYLSTEPGDVYRMTYDIPHPSSGAVTLMIRSKGFYTEWVRGTWITGSREQRRFDLFRINETMDTLTDKWLRERKDMESMFFRTRIPISEEP
jgi:hypothetical protein